MPRKRHVSRNTTHNRDCTGGTVMPRKRHVSRNKLVYGCKSIVVVMPRKRHVSRNFYNEENNMENICHASQEACE